MSTIKVLNGNYRGIPVIDTVFELVTGFQTGAKGSYVTVKTVASFLVALIRSVSVLTTSRISSILAE